MKKSLIVFIFLFLTGCSYIPWQSESSSVVTDEEINDLVMYAMSLTETPYRYGGNDSDEGFDCSGFVEHVYKNTLKITLPRTSTEMSDKGKSIRDSRLRPGDLVFFNTRHQAYSHVGIYVGEGKFIHSPKSGSQIQVTSMKDGYWANRYDGARRVY
jgi:cell wall-associated NlpC family hydrolase